MKSTYLKYEIYNAVVPVYNFASEPFIVFKGGLWYQDRWCCHRAQSWSPVTGREGK